MISDRSGWLIALLIGALSALAFQPVGWWPLMPLAFAGLCVLIDRAPSLKRALLTGWLFGLGQFCIGLNWIATAFTYQSAMPAWLGWVAVVLLSLYLAVYPALAAGARRRFGTLKNGSGPDRPLAVSRAAICTRRRLPTSASSSRAGSTPTAIVMGSRRRCRPSLSGIRRRIIGRRDRRSWVRASRKPRSLCRAAMSW